jgi:hypothetical protein
MFYEEKVIEGVLMCRTSPDGEWKPVDNKTLLDRLQKAEEAAARWNALLASDRIRVLGTAGFGEHTTADPDYRHFGMEVWSIHPCKDSEYGREVLTKYADSVISMMAHRQDDKPVYFYEVGMVEGKHEDYTVSGLPSTLWVCSEDEQDWQLIERIQRLGLNDSVAYVKPVPKEVALGDLDFTLPNEEASFKYHVEQSTKL